MVGSAGAAQPAQQNRTVVRCLPGDWIEGPVPDITASHQGITTSAGFDVVTSLSIILYKTMHEMSEPE